jgi:uncharacterized surface protein with fasciclin (FAS1) repeats
MLDLLCTQAFGKIPKATLDAVIADVPTLTNILTYHVTNGAVESSDLKNGQKVTMLNKDKTTIGMTLGAT